MTMILNALRDEIHAIAKEKGWWNEERSSLEIHALIHSEISEATENVRNNEDAYHHHEECAEGIGGKHKPEGEAVELVDAMIRILDYFGKKGWDADKIMRDKIEFNKTREYRHGGKSK